MGCSCRSFSINDLEEDEDLAEKITQSKNREASTSNPRENSYAEFLDSDNDDD